MNNMNNDIKTKPAIKRMPLTPVNPRNATLPQPEKVNRRFRGQPSENLAAEAEPDYKSDIEMNRVQIDIGRDWTVAKDLDYFNSIWATHITEGEDHYEFMLRRIGANLDFLSHTLDEAAIFLSPCGVNPEVLELLSIADKLELLRKLFVYYLPQVPPAHHRKYLLQFNEDLDRCQQTEALGRAVIRKFILNPSNTWLSELDRVGAWIGITQLDLEDDLDCELDGFQSWRQKLSRRETLAGDV